MEAELEDRVLVNDGGLGEGEREEGERVSFESRLELGCKGRTTYAIQNASNGFQCVIQPHL